MGVSPLLLGRPPRFSAVREQEAFPVLQAGVEHKGRLRARDNRQLFRQIVALVSTSSPWAFD